MIKRLPQRPAGLPKQVWEMLTTAEKENVHPQGGYQSKSVGLQANFTVWDKQGKPSDWFFCKDGTWLRGFHSNGGKLDGFIVNLKEDKLKDKFNLGN